MSRGNPEMQPGGWLGAGGEGLGLGGREGGGRGASQGPRALRAGGRLLGAGAGGRELGVAGGGGWGLGRGGMGAGSGPKLDWELWGGLAGLAVYGGLEGGAGGWGLGHGCDTPATHANASRTLANACERLRTLRERFSDDPWSTIGPLDPNL